MIVNTLLLLFFSPFHNTILTLALLPTRTLFVQCNPIAKTRLHTTLQQGCTFYNVLLQCQKQENKDF